MQFNPGVSAYAVKGITGKLMHGKKRETAAVVFPIIDRMVLNINRRISWGPMKGNLKVLETGYRGQGAAVRVQRTGVRSQETRIRRCSLKKIVRYPETRTLDPGPCINLRHDGFAELDRDHAGTARFFHGDAV